MPCTDLLFGIPTQAHAAEVRDIVSQRYSASSRSSIASAQAHWETVCAKWGWPSMIETGDPERGGKLATFVLHLMAHEKEPGCFYPSSTISNYVWALCAMMQENLHADPRVNVIGWRIFMASVVVMCYVPYEPRKRVPTASIRTALENVDKSDFAMVQMAVFVLFLYFTFQRSEFPCPKTYAGVDPAKHLFVKHVEPHEGGFRFAVGTTKADPRAERLSSDAGPGREWIVVGEVNDALWDLRVWLCLLFQFYPEGPRDPDSLFFRNTTDKTRAYLYSAALTDFRRFVGDDEAGLHGVRSEGFVVCSNSVGEEAAVIQGGWRGLISASRYDRLTREVQASMAANMVAFCNPSADVAAVVAPMGVVRRSDSLNIAARRAAAKSISSSVAAPPGGAAASSASGRAAALPPGWRRVWHSSPRGGYASYVGPCGRHARSIKQAVRMAAEPSAPPPPAAAAPRNARAAPAARPSSSSVISVDNLVDHVTFFNRPPARRAPSARAPVSSS